MWAVAAVTLWDSSVSDPVRLSMQAVFGRRCSKLVFSVHVSQRNLRPPFPTDSQRFDNICHETAHSHTVQRLKSSFLIHNSIFDMKETKPGPTNIIQFQTAELWHRNFQICTSGPLHPFQPLCNTGNPLGSVAQQQFRPTNEAILPLAPPAVECKPVSFVLSHCPNWFWEERVSGRFIRRKRRYGCRGRKKRKK